MPKFRGKLTPEEIDQMRDVRDRASRASDRASDFAAVDIVRLPA